MLKPHDEMPNATVSHITDAGFEDVRIKDLFRQGTNILVGVPGAFTPICTEDHLPSLIENADMLRQAGAGRIFCISDDHCWALDAWRKTLPGSEKIEFLSDGNRDFLHKIKMENPHRELYLEGRYSRFYAVIHECRIKRLRAEQSVLKTVSTSGECILSDIRDIVAREDMKE